MKTIDPYLTGRAEGNLDRTAAVYAIQHSAGVDWMLERDGEEPVRLGATFQEARSGLGALIRQARAQNRIAAAGRGEHVGGVR